MFRLNRVLKSAEHSFIGRPYIYERPIFYQQVSDFAAKTEENNFGNLKSWTKPEVDEAVLDLLYDCARVPAEKV